MKAMQLEPYSAILTFSIDGEKDETVWRSMIIRFMESLGRNCEEAGASVIGHIKAIATFPNNGFFRVSVVGADIPADAEGDLPAGGLQELDMTLNVLVYDLSLQMLHKLVLDATRDKDAIDIGTVSVRHVCRHLPIHKI